MGSNDWPPLITDAELDGFGGPFTPGQVAAAIEKVRLAAGWHIAPTITETLIFDHDGASVLPLGSLHVTGVESVRDVSGATPRDVEGFRWSSSGMVSGRLPCGFRSVEVTFTHGFEKCPEALLPVIAEAARVEGRARSQGAGPFQVTYMNDDDNFAAAQRVLDQFKLGPRP